VNHYASPDFWASYQALPSSVQHLADKAFAQLKADSKHPSLHFKKIRRFWSARVGQHYRAIGVEVPNGVLWLWIGSHSEYDRLVAS
jgi:hypothetical protein